MGQLAGHVGVGALMLSGPNAARVTAWQLAVAAANR